MSSFKALKLTVELDIRAVTCPGVFLPSKGDVLVRFWLLGSTARTKSIHPTFPLVYGECFLFDKVFGTCQQLPDLHHRLSRESIRVELQQFRRSRSVTLASFECSLLTLLYPDLAQRPNLHCREQLSLCMEPDYSFPGVLPPKLQISTRTMIEEEISGPASSCLKKTISSETSHCPGRRNIRTIRQLARQAHDSRALSPEPRQGRPPFVVRHVEEDIFKYSPQLEVDRSYERNSSSRLLRPSRHLRSRENLYSSLSSEEDLCCAVKPPLHSTGCGHPGCSCTVCQLYQEYFGARYNQHQHEHHSRCRSHGCYNAHHCTSPPHQRLSQWCWEKRHQRCNERSICHEVLGNCRNTQF